MIGLNSIILKKKSGGVGVYINKLINFILGTNRHDILIFLNNNYAKILIQNDAIKSIKLPTSVILRASFENVLWKKIIKEYNITLFHSPFSYLPRSIDVPSLVTIHDLGTYHFPENYTFLRQSYLRKMIERSALKAQKIIAVSKFTKNDISETLGINEEKITVIYEGIDIAKFQNKSNNQKTVECKEYLNSEEPFILSVGHLEPRKNYVRLIQAFDILKKKKNIKHKLVIVGQENWKYQAIYHEVDKLNLKSEVIFTKFVDEERLIGLYQSADLFVTASTYEGFGFTPLESMAAGTPVAASNSTSIPEIVGDAALLFNPYDPDDMADKMYRALEDHKLRVELINKGKENIKRFNWDTCCQKTLNLYDEILHNLQ